MLMNRGRVEEKNLFIEKGSHISFGPGEYTITCSKGIVWLTWPWSSDVILNGGDEISFRAEGALCVKAFAGSILNIKKKKIYPCIKSIPRLLAMKTFNALLSFVKDGAGEPVFGESVHSLTR
jgi:hypothetical protein